MTSPSLESVRKFAPPASPAPRKKGHFWRNVAWFFGFLIVCELVLRLFGYGAYVQFHPDDRVLWLPTPGANQLTNANHAKISINDEDFRYPTHLGPKKPGEFRIFAFGDSVTMGWGVDDNSHYSAILEKDLNSAGCADHVQVISAGVNAYPNSLVDERAKSVLESDLQPDMVVIAYSFNTGMERLVHVQGAEKKKILRGVVMKSMLRRSALYSFLIEDVMRGLAYYRFRELMLNGTWDTAKEKPDDPPSVFTANLQSAYDEAQARHVPVVLLVLGSDKQTGNGDLHPYQKAMMDFAQANHVPVVNMIEAWRTRDRAPLFMDHVHPTQPGHELIANDLAQVVKTQPAYAAACQANSSEKSVAQQ